MNPATYNFNSQKRGDTAQAFQIAKVEYSAGVGVPIASARLQIRTAGGIVMHEWSTALGTITLSGSPVVDTVTLSALTKAVTELFVVGTHTYDLEITTTGGEVWTILDGTYVVAADKTRT